MILKLCSYTSCSKVIDKDSKYCEYHRAKHMKKERVRYKEYQKRRLYDERKAMAQSFYSSTDWRRIKEAIKPSYYHIDIMEYYLTGKVVEGQVVHHVIEVEEEWDSRLDISNLIYLTYKNHQRIHMKYNKSLEDKRRVQKMLLGLIEQFEKEFCF